MDCQLHLKCSRPKVQSIPKCLLLDLHQDRGHLQVWDRLLVWWCQEDLQVWDKWALHLVWWVDHLQVWPEAHPGWEFLPAKAWDHHLVWDNLLAWDHLQVWPEVLQVWFLSQEWLEDHHSLVNLWGHLREWQEDHHNNLAKTWALAWGHLLAWLVVHKRQAKVWKEVREWDLHQAKEWWALLQVWFAQWVHLQVSSNPNLDTWLTLRLPHPCNSSPNVNRFSSSHQCNPSKHPLLLQLLTHRIHLPF